MEAFETVHGHLITIRDWVRFGASSFNEAGVFFGHGTNNAIDEALGLVLHSLHLRHDVTADFLDSRVTSNEAAGIYQLLQRRIDERVPLAYITNRTDFAGLSFYVDQRVLVPRSPIAELVEQRFQPWIHPDGVVSRILDLCTGSGCIGIACAYAFPEAEITLSDVEESALEVARINVKEHALENRANVVQSDLFNGLDGRLYDLIVCNPPYVPSETYSKLPSEYFKEPRGGLVSGRGGLDHALRVLHEAAEHLTTDGLLVLEVGQSRNLLELTCPDLALTWIEFENGGEGVAVISRDELSQLGEQSKASDLSR